MKCNLETPSCPELYDIFFYMRGKLAMQEVPRIEGQALGETLSVCGTAGVVEGENKDVEGVKYNSTQDPLI